MAMNVWNGQWLKGLSCSGWDLAAVGIIVLVILAAIWIGIGLIRGAGQRRLDRVMSSSLTTQVFLFLSFNAVMVVFAVAVGYLLGSNPWNVITAYTFGNLEHLPTWCRWTSAGLYLDICWGYLYGWVVDFDFDQYHQQAC
ncbi:MAG TPA: hypothetical protein PLK40_08565 [Bacteroidaceae bacterium]|nr:hypothetical protein [Bacteroidaceae bacterium]